MKVTIALIIYFLSTQLVAFLNDIPANDAKKQALLAFADSLMIRES
jgi:hypothetical protein